MAANPLIERMLALIAPPPLRAVVRDAAPYEPAPIMAAPRVIVARDDAPVVMRGRIASESDMGARQVGIAIALDPLGEQGQGGGGNSVTFNLPPRVGNKFRRGERWELILRRIDDDEG
jgi:hypothetical protein